MANDNNDRNRKRLVNFICILGIVVLLVLYHEHPEFFEPSDNSTLPEDTLQEIVEQTNFGGEELYLHMIDVGQADSFLFVQGKKTALIDCGTRDTGKEVVSYINDMGITKLDYVFGTHPHDDHMGGMYDVVSNFEIGEIIMPKVKDGLVTTNWYMKLLKKIKEDNIKVVYPEVGDVFNLETATMKVVEQFEPGEAGNNLNNYSTVIKVTLGQMDVLMTGDAETQVEKSILSSGEYIDSEVLKVGHHGSDTSTSKEFLDAVDPDYGLISCKVGNKYNHPIKSTMDKLENSNVIVYRTDECGDVILTITENNISFNKEPGDYLSGSELAEGE